MADNNKQEEKIKNEQPKNEKETKLTKSSDKVKEAEEVKSKNISAKSQNNFTEELKEIEQLQTDGMQETALARKKNRVKFRVLIILLLLLIVGVGVAVFFVMQNQRHRDVHIIADVTATSYLAYPSSQQEMAKDKFSFRAEDASSQKFTKDIVCILEANSTLKMVYNIENKTVNKYTYMVDFQGLTIENVNVVCYAENGNRFTLSEDNSLYTLSSKDRFLTIVVEIEVADIEADATCFGQIDFTLTTV